MKLIDFYLQKNEYSCKIRGRNIVKVCLGGNHRMVIDKMQQTTFEQKTYEEWQEIAVNSLRGLPFDNLITKTIEGIDLYPLYTEQSEKLASLDPIREAKNEIGWTVAQQQYTTNANDYMQQLKDSLSRGNEAIVYDGTTVLNWNEETLTDLAKYVTKYPVYFFNVSKNDSIIQVFEKIKEDNKETVIGIVELNGESPLLEGFKHIRTIGADTTEAHHLGADAVTELALALAKATDEVDRLGSFSQLSERFFARFAIDTHFFMEIAKLRAFRVLWQALSSAYGEESSSLIPLITETSKRSYSMVDPYVNLLRAGNSAFSAILGGTDVLTVHPHDILTSPTEISIRLARNVQLVIKEETLVTEVLDPSGGAYFIESLTKELVEKAWALFVDIEAFGGYALYVDSDLYKKRIEKLHKERINDVAKGKHSLVGTSVYADLSATDQNEANSIVRGRLAEPFEKFRRIFKDEQPNIALLTFGALKDFKARADFVSGFFASGGLTATWSPAFETVEEALNWLSEKQLDYVVICATNARTEEVVGPFLEKVSKQFVIDVAGKFSEEQSKEWLEKGLDGFIYQGLNKLEKFSNVLHRWKGDIVHEKA